MRALFLALTLASAVAPAVANSLELSTLPNGVWNGNVKRAIEESGGRTLSGTLELVLASCNGNARIFTNGEKVKANELAGIKAGRSLDGTHLFYYMAANREQPGWEELQTFSVLELSDSKAWLFSTRAVNNRNLQIDHPNKYFWATTMGQLERVSSYCMGQGDDAGNKPARSLATVVNRVAVGRVSFDVPAGWTTGPVEDGFKASSPDEDELYVKVWLPPEEVRASAEGSAGLLRASTEAYINNLPPERRRFASPFAPSAPFCNDASAVAVLHDAANDLVVKYVLVEAGHVYEFSFYGASDAASARHRYADIIKSVSILNSDVGGFNVDLVVGEGPHAYLKPSACE